MEEFKQMAKKKEPTNGELMAKEIIEKYKSVRNKLLYVAISFHLL